MVQVDPAPTVTKWIEDTGFPSLYFFQLIDGLWRRSGGNSDPISLITVTQAIDLDYITVTQAVDLDTMEVDVAASKVITDFITITQAVNLDTVETDAAASKVVTDFITITQAVNLDTMESDLSTVVADLNTLEAVTLTAGNGLTGTGTLASAPTLAVGAGTGITVAADAISTNDGAIDHDALLNFASDKHVAHSGVTMTAGNGLTAGSGGTIASNRTFTVGAGTGITVNTNDVAIDTSVVIDKSGISTYVPSNEAVVRSWDANAGDGSISSSPTQAEVENIRDALVQLSDVVATLVNDLGLS